MARRPSVDANAMRAEKRTGEDRSPSERALFVNSLRKGFVVLQAFSRERPRLSLAAITRETGLDKSAAQRFVYTLHELGYLRKDEQTKQYSLSPRLLEFAYTYLYSDVIIERAQPFLVEAHDKTGETVNLAVLDATEIILISRIPSRHVVSINIQIGIRIPAVYSASGRVIAAGLDAAAKRRLLRESLFRAHTAHTVTSREEMAKLVEKAGADGYSIAVSQFFLGDVSVAAPVFDKTGVAVAAVSISAPDSRFSLEEVRTVLLPAAIEAARKTSVAMGAF